MRALEGTLLGFKCVQRHTLIYLDDVNYWTRVIFSELYTWEIHLRKVRIELHSLKILEGKNSIDQYLHEGVQMDKRTIQMT